jgi:hypothetical protein
MSRIQRPSNDTQRTALHEAGHAIIARVLDLKPGRATATT